MVPSLFANQNTFYELVVRIGISKDGILVGGVHLYTVLVDRYRHRWKIDENKNNVNYFKNVPAQFIECIGFNRSIPLHSRTFLVQDARAVSYSNCLEDNIPVACLFIGWNKQRINVIQCDIEYTCWPCTNLWICSIFPRNVD